MGGGGGGSGQVGYADYIEHSHEMMIVGDYAGALFADNLETVLATALANNPYATHTAYNPDTALTAMETARDNFSDVSDSLIDDAVLVADMEAYNDELEAVEIASTLPKYNTLMRDIGAVQSSSFADGAAKITAERVRNVNSYYAKNRVEWKRLYIQSQSELAQTTVTIEKTRIAAKHDEEQRDAEIDRLSALWKVDTLNKGGQFLGILGGGTMVPEGPSKAQSAIAGGLAGMATGAYVGSVVPGVGTAIGAAAGGIIGAGASFMG